MRIWCICDSYVYIEYASECMFGIILMCDAWWWYFFIVCTNSQLYYARAIWISFSFRSTVCKCCAIYALNVFNVYIIKKKVLTWCSWHWSTSAKIFLVDLWICLNHTQVHTANNNQQKRNHTEAFCMQLASTLVVVVTQHLKLMHWFILSFNTICKFSSWL